MTARAVQPITGTYGWTAEGKTPAEIAGDIRHTRYRLDADVRDLKRKVAQVKWPALVAALAGVVLLIRRIRR